MELTYKETKVHYKILGNGDNQVVFLHGWGGNIDSFSFVCKDLDFNYKALLIDFPPFGESAQPKETFTIFDYAQIVKRIMQKEKFNNALLIAHSFGGRVATILGSESFCRGLVLTSSAGMKVKHGLKYYYKVYKHKLLKKMGFNSSGGSNDYKLLPDGMKKTFLNIVNTNLEKYAIHINVPCVLVWGGKDKDTPYYMAKKLKKLIKNSEIVLYKKSGHFCYLENYGQFVAIINHMAKNT